MLLPGTLSPHILCFSFATGGLVIDLGSCTFFATGAGLPIDLFKLTALQELSLGANYLGGEGVASDLFEVPILVPSTPC